MTGRCAPRKATPRRQHSHVLSCATPAGSKLSPPSEDQENTNAAPGYDFPAARAATALRLSSQAANRSPPGSNASVSKRWLVRSTVIGRGAAQLAPPSVERLTITRPL